MSDRYDPALESALADLATAVRFPPTPSLATAVASSLVAQPPIGWVPRFGPLRRSLVLAVAGLFVLAGLAGALGIGIGAIQIRFADGTPLPTPVASVGNRGFGTETTLAGAQAAVPFRVLLPADPALGEPDAVFLADVPKGGTVSLVWGERPGYPADDAGIGLVVTQFSADIGPDTFQKMVTSGTRVDPVSVNGQPGWWVAGGTHAFFYRDVDGQYVDASLRLVTSALIWEEDGLALRVEGAPNLEAALRVAVSLE
ncbi:MAG: hypothetical protein ACRDFZ_05805 [Candidatus Limnocylindria bacterium]